MADIRKAVDFGHFAISGSAQEVHLPDAVSGLCVAPTIKAGRIGFCLDVGDIPCVAGDLALSLDAFDIRGFFLFGPDRSACKEQQNNDHDQEEPRPDLPFHLT